MPLERPASEHRSRDFGPYNQFSAVDGIAYADDRVFAFVDGKVGDWFCYEDGHHWQVMVVTDASGAQRNHLLSLAGIAPLLPGVIALWQGARLLYLGRALSLRRQLQRLAGDWSSQDVTAVSWEKHHDPTTREAELFAEYERTSRLIEKAKETITRSSWVQDDARMIRANRSAVAA